MAQSHDAMVAQVVADYLEPEKLYMAYNSGLSSYVAPFHELIICIYNEHCIVIGKPIDDTLSNEEKYKIVAHNCRQKLMYHQFYEIDSATHMITNMLPMDRIISMIDQL
jgi:hypothetical protein